MGISKYENRDERDGIKSAFKFFEQLNKEH